MTQIKRSEVPMEETWDLTPIYASDEAWRQAYSEISNELAQWEQRSLTFNSSQALLNNLLDYDRLLSRLNRITNYARYKYSEDGTDPSHQQMLGEAQYLTQQASAIQMEFVQAVLSISSEELKQFLSEEKELNEFQRFFQRLEQIRDYSLTYDMEKTLAALNQMLQAPENLFQTITSADLTFEPVVDGDGNRVPVSLHMYMTQVETSPDTTLRRNAFHSLTEGLKDYQHGIAHVLSTEINKNVSLAKLRGYPSALDMHLQYSVPSMGGFSTDGMSTQFFEDILDTFQEQLAPHMRRYANLRKKQLGLDELLFSDVKAPLDPDYDPKVSYEEAGDIITKAVGVLGEEYQERMSRVFKERWVYRADNVGRRMIPFGGGVHEVHGYSFYPWGGNLFDVLLLGHELGHTLHFTLSGEHQRIINNSQSLLFVESPSTLVEHLIVNYLREKNDDPRLHRWLNMYLMMSYHHNCVTHILEAELLRRLYKLAEDQVPLTTAIMNQTKGDILSQFWGDTVVIDEGAKLTWMRQPHYYMGLYPFAYSVGISASTIISERIQKEGIQVGKQWTEVLKQGGNMNGFKLFEMAGVNMSTTENLEKAIAYVGSIVDELERSF